jgi:hypothetical protein
VRRRRLAKRLFREPVELPDDEGGTILFGYDELVGETLGAMYDPAATAQTLQAAGPSKAALIPPAIRHLLER